MMPADFRAIYQRNENVRLNRIMNNLRKPLAIKQLMNGVCSKITDGDEFIGLLEQRGGLPAEPSPHLPTMKPTHDLWSRALLQKLR